MVQNDAQAGAIDVSIQPIGVATPNDLAAEFDFVKSMYPNLEAV